MDRARARGTTVIVTLLWSLLLVAGCGEDDQQATAAREASFDDIELTGTPLLGKLVRTAGERFALNTNSEVQVEPAHSDTAFGALCAAEVAGAMTERRPTDAERAACEAEGVGVIELMGGYHAVGVAANPELDIECLTATNLRQLWREESPVETYAALRPTLPDRPVSLYAPHAESPSLRLFREAILGRLGIRDDFEVVTERRVFISEVAGNSGASGFYNLQEIDSAAPARLRLVAVAGDNGCVAPSSRSVQAGRYDVLSRPLYMYVSRAALEEPEVSRYMQFLFENYAQAAATTTTIVPLGPAQVREELAKLPQLPSAPE